MPRVWVKYLAIIVRDQPKRSETFQSSMDLMLDWARNFQPNPLALSKAHSIIGATGTGKTTFDKQLFLARVLQARKQVERELPSALFPGLLREGDANRIDEVQRRNHQLTLQLERLRSEVVAAKRSELTVRRQAEYLEAQNDAQLSCIGELAKTNRAAQAALIAAKEGRICLHETHFGVVAEREGDEVAVVYERPDGDVEQIYDRIQFVDGKLPEVGDTVEAHVIVASRRRGAVPGSTEMGTEGKTDEFSAFREKGVTGPTKI